MSNEEYKEYIIEMIQKINNPEHLKRIFNYVHKFLSGERAGKPVFYYVKILFKYSFNTCL